ncbi:hypothetical protein BC828DRAFT_265623 [Blastocladiella britannica]|nr:hypothetical protein BC828DRAFT_265623 [Blastocladiella britannica]
MALRDTATGTIASSQFTYNTSPTISGYATALLVSGGSATISQSEFTGNSGGQTGAIAFVNGRGNITDTVIRGNSGSVIMAVRAAGTSAVSMRACSISGHNGAPRLVQISEAAQVVMDGMDIYGNTQGWLLGLYTSSSLLLSNTLIYDNSFAGTSAFYIGQGLLATFRNVTFANNNATTYLIVGDRSSDLRMASTVFTGTLHNFPHRILCPL